MCFVKIDLLFEIQNDLGYRRRQLVRLPPYSMSLTYASDKQVMHYNWPSDTAENDRLKMKATKELL